MNRRVRIGMAAASAVLLGIEILIGMFAHGWVRDQLGDILVVILIYTIWRTISPEKPKLALLLPAGILLFAYCVEYLQFWGFCDRLHITNRLLRIIIGTGYSNKDMLSYTVGILPCILCENLLRRPEPEQGKGIYLPAILTGLCGALWMMSLLLHLSAYPVRLHPIAFPVSLVCGMTATILCIVFAALLTHRIRQAAVPKNGKRLCTLILCAAAILAGLPLWKDAFALGRLIVQRL